MNDYIKSGAITRNVHILYQFVQAGVCIMVIAMETAAQLLYVSLLCI